MANVRIKFTQTIADINGQLATISYTDAAQSDASTLATMITTLNAFGTAFAAATNGKPVRGSFEVLGFEAQLIPGTPPPTNALYPTVTTGARLNFSNSFGSTAHITIPAPVAGVFLAAPQEDFVDPAGSASALITFLQGALVDVGGHALNLYQGGIKVGKRARRRRPPKAGLS